MSFCHTLNLTKKSLVFPHLRSAFNAVFIYCHQLQRPMKCPLAFQQKKKEKAKDNNNNNYKRSRELASSIIAV